MAATSKKATTATLLWLLMLCLSPTPAAAETPRGQADDTRKDRTYLIEIDIPKCQLSAYELLDSKRVLISTHKVATAKKGLKKYPTGTGTITRVEAPPYWRPTAYTRRYFAEKGIDLPRVVPPHHELNYLGDFKARLSHTVPGKGQIYSIHGNNDPAKLGKRATGGCIRMDNHEGLELIRRNILRPGTRVYITGGATKSS